MFDVRWQVILGGFEIIVSVMVFWLCYVLIRSPYGRAGNATERFDRRL